jgi:hypothetical protein
VLVATVVSPTSNAAYYIAAMIASFLFMVPMHLSTVLFAIASSAPEMIAEKLRFVLRTCLVIGVPAGLVIGLSSHYVLSAFGSNYASLATGPLWLMIAGYLPGLPSVVYIAVCRATGRISHATVFLSTFAVIQMIAVVVGGKLDGLYGLSYGALAVAIVESFITTPRVLRAAFGSAPVQAAIGPITSGQARLRSAELADELRLQQEAGINALISLATAVALDHRPRSSAAAHRKSKTVRTHVGSETRVDLQAVRTTTTGQSARRSWADIDEATFRQRQEAGVAALIAIATHAARF